MKIMQYMPNELCPSLRKEYTKLDYKNNHQQTKYPNFRYYCSMIIKTRQHRLLDLEILLLYYDSIFIFEDLKKNFSFINQIKQINILPKKLSAEKDKLKMRSGIKNNKIRHEK